MVKRQLTWNGIGLFMVFFVFSLTASGIIQPVRAADSQGVCQKDLAVTMVHSSAAGLGGLFKNTTDEKKRIELMRAFIDPIRFYPDKSGYFYIYNLDCLNLAHATQKDLQGKNLSNYKDSKGKFVIRELASAAKKGGGFVEYYWIKPGTQKEEKKLGYVEPIPGTNYFIGTGIYLP